MTVPARIIGRGVVVVLDLTRPWAAAVRTSRVTLDDGRVVVYQAGLPTAAGRAGIARRMRLGGRLGVAAPELRVPAVLDGDPAADPPFLVTAFVPGRTGGELLGSAAEAVVLGRVAGGAAGAVALVPPRSLGGGLARTWADERRLRRIGFLTRHTIGRLPLRWRLAPQASSAYRREGVRPPGW